MFISYFSHGRTALKYGLKSIKNINSILVPNFICDAVTNTIKKENIEIIYYRVKSNFEPDWSHLQTLSTEKTSAILMMHFFGIPQNINKFIEFASKNKLTLIEDNAHGYGGKYNSVFLGDIGDLSISSPRKLCNTPSGGILKLNNKDLYNNISYNLKKYPLSFRQKLSFLHREKFSNSKNFFKKILFKRPKYEKITHNSETIKDYLMDDYSKKIIDQTNINSMIINRVKKFNKWQKFAIDNKLNTIFKDLENHNLNPWCCPIYSNSYEETIYWYKWGWKNKIFVFSWPDLPIELMSDEDVINRKKTLICFSTN